MDKVSKSAQLRELAEKIEANPNNRDHIAAGFRLIAEAMEPCEDCGAILHGSDLPEAGDTTEEAAAGV